MMLQLLHVMTHFHKKNEMTSVILPFFFIITSQLFGIEFYYFCLHAYVLTFSHNYVILHVCVLVLRREGVRGVAMT